MNFYNKILPSVKVQTCKHNNTTEHDGFVKNLKEALTQRSPEWSMEPILSVMVRALGNYGPLEHGSRWWSLSTLQAEHSIHSATRILRRCRLMCEKAHNHKSFFGRMRQTAGQWKLIQFLLVWLSKECTSQYNSCTAELCTSEHNILCCCHPAA